MPVMTSSHKKYTLGHSIGVLYVVEILYFIKKIDFGKRVMAHEQNVVAAEDDPLFGQISLDDETNAYKAESDEDSPPPYESIILDDSAVRDGGRVRCKLSVMLLLFFLVSEES